jgi:hypothetical protein
MEIIMRLYDAIAKIEAAGFAASISAVRPGIAADDSTLAVHVYADQKTEDSFCFIIIDDVVHATYDEAWLQSNLDAMVAARAAREGV